MLILGKTKIIKKSKLLAFLCITLAGSSLVKAEIVSEINTAEAICKDQSEEMLEELGLAPKAWAAENNNSDGKFNIEGHWQTRNGGYIVECEIPYKADADQLVVRLFQV